MWQYANKCPDAEPTEPEYMQTMTERWSVILFRCCSSSFHFAICGDPPTFLCVVLFSSRYCFTFLLWCRWCIHVDVRLLSRLLEWSPDLTSLEVFFPLLLWTQVLDGHRKSSLHRRCRSLLPARHWCTSMNQWWCQRRHGRQDQSIA